MPTQIQSADISAGAIRFVTEENLVSGSNVMYINTNYSPIGFSNLFIHATVTPNTYQVNPAILSMNRALSTLYVTQDSGILESITSGGVASLIKVGFGSGGDVKYAPNQLVYSAGSRVYSLSLVDTGVSVYAGNGSTSYDDYTGPAISGAMGNASYLSYDSFGNLYITDFKKIRKVDSSGMMYTVVGATGLDHTFVENMNAQSFSPGDDYNGEFRNTAVNSSGVLHFCTADYLILRLTSSGTLQRVAGIQGDPGYDGEYVVATGSRVNGVSSLEFDSNDNLYLYNGGNARLMKIDGSGTMYTVAGNGTQASTSADNSTTGTATALSISVNGGLVIDGYGNIFLGSSWPDKRIRIVNTSGVISTIYGDGSTPNTYGEYLYQSSYVPLPYVSGSIVGVPIRYCLVSGNQVMVDASNLTQTSPVFIDKINIAYTTYETP